MYIVHELYDIKGYSGYKSTEQVISGVFGTKADACAFKRKYHNPYIYNKTLELWCGGYVVTEIDPLQTDVYNRLHRINLCNNCPSREICEGK